MKFLKSVLKKIKNIIVGFKRRNKNLFTLVSMQLKEKWNISFKANVKTSLFNLISYILLFVVICVVSYLLMGYAANLCLLSPSPIIPINVMTLLFTIITVLEFLSLLVGLTNSLYASKDNFVLITYPIKANTLFLSKIIVYLADTIKKTFSFLVPILVGFGLVSGYGVVFYLWILFGGLLYCILLVVIAALLSIPTLFVLKFVGRFKVVKVLIAFLLCDLVIFVGIKVMNLIPENINLISSWSIISSELRSFLTDFDKANVPFSALATFFCGQYSNSGFSISLFTPITGTVLLIIIVLIVVFTLANYFISLPIYLSMISKKFEFDKTNAFNKPNIRLQSKTSPIFYELLRILRDESIVTDTLIFVVITPLLTLLFNKVYSSTPARLLGYSIINASNFGLLMLAVIVHNVSVSYIYSKDGPSWVIAKTAPIDARYSLLARLTYYLISSLLIIVPSFFIIVSKTSYMPASRVPTVFNGWTLATMICLAIFVILLAADYDLTHSKNKLKNEIGTEEKGKHMGVGFATGLVFSLIFTVLILLFSLKGDTLPYVRTFIFALLMVVVRVLLFTYKIKAIFQEDQ